MHTHLASIHVQYWNIANILEVAYPCHGPFLNHLLPLLCEMIPLHIL